MIPKIRQRSLWRDSRGAAIMEMAVASPLFFLLMFGIADFSRAIWMYGTLAHGAREAARFAIVRGDESGRAVTAGDVEDFVHDIMGLRNSTVTTTWLPNNNPGSSVQVQVQETFVPAVPFFPSVPLSTRSRLVISF